MKLCALFQSHHRIQTRVTVRKRSIHVKIGDFCVPCDLEIWQMTLKNNRAPLLCYFNLCPSFYSHQSFETGIKSLETPISGQNLWFFVPCDLEMWSMTLKKNRAPLLCYFKFWPRFIAIGQFKLELESGNTKFGSKLAIFFVPCDLQILQMTLKNNTDPLLCYTKLCASFNCHMWIQTRVRVHKRLNWVFISVNLTFDLWPWPLAWTSLLSMVITPENFIMIWWKEHCEKGVTDRRTDGKKCSKGCLFAAKKSIYMKIMWEL